MKVLITGAGGYIGSVSTYLFLQKGYEVVAIDNFSIGFREPLELLQEKFTSEKLRFYDIDLKADLSEVFNKEKDIDTVVNYAASCSVDESVKNPGLYFSNNVGCSANLLETVVNYGIKNFVFSSTCAVYGNAKYVPVDEKHPTNPENPYGESKLMMEKIIEWYGKLKDLNYVILRYFNVCGASDDGLIGDSKKPSVHLMQNAVRGALKIEPFFLTYQEFETTPDRSPIRDYLNVVDLNEAHISAVEYLSRGGTSETINLGTGTGNSVLEIVNKIGDATGVTFDLQKAEARKGEYDKMVATIDKARKVLNWQPKRSIEDSIKSLITWYNNHPNGWSR